MNVVVGLEYLFFEGDLSSVVSKAMAATQHQQTHCFAVDFMRKSMQSSVVSEYDLGGEGDLFKAPEAIVEEPTLPIDPITANMSSIVSVGDDAITEAITAESIQNDNLDDVLYQCKKDLIEKSVIKEPIPELFNVDIPSVHPEFTERQQILKSVSTGCLSSIGNTQTCMIKPSFLEFQGLDFDAAFGLRRAYSEGDIQNLSVNYAKTEERKQKLSRYWEKKRQRNFGRKIKYACRKTLADNQPRVRGRFAKAEASDSSKRCKVTNGQTKENGCSPND